jgi:hypothetical protein
VLIQVGGASPDSVAIQYQITDVQAWVMTHEIGHALGASHVTAEKDLMSSPPVGWGGNFASEGFSTYKVQIYLQNTFVDSLRFLTFDDRRIKTFESSGTLEHRFIGLFSELRFQPEAPILIADSQGGRGPWMGDRIVFSGDGTPPKPRSSARLAGIQSIAMRAAGMPEFRILDENPPGTGTDIVGPRSTLVPLRLFPNPFHARTLVEFSLARGGDVVASVHDITGRRVQTLHLGILGPGVHTRIWDARGADGVRLAPGVYVLRVRSAGAAGAARVVVLPLGSP